MQYCQLHYVYYQIDVIFIVGYRKSESLCSVAAFVHHIQCCAAIQYASQRILDRCMDLHPRCLKSMTTDRQRGRARKPQSAKPNWHALKTNGLTWTSPSSGAPPTARTTRRPLPRCSLQQESLFRNDATQNRMCRAVNGLRSTFSRQTLK